MNPIETAIVALIHSEINTEAVFKSIVDQPEAGIELLFSAIEGKLTAFPANGYFRDIIENLEGVIWLLAEANPQAVIDALKIYPKHTVSLVWALGASKSPLALEALIQATSHKEPWVRWAAAEGLVRFKRKTLLPVFHRLLRDRSSTVAFTALEGLGKLKDPTSKEPLEIYLRKKSLAIGARQLADKTLAAILKKAETIQ